MTYLLDTQLVLRFAMGDKRMPLPVRAMIASAELIFVSSASLWEIAIKQGLGRADFQINLKLLTRELGRGAFRELPVNGEHALAVLGLPKFHKDPFDRLLIAQAMVESLTLLTTDRTVAKYPGPVQRV